MKLRRTYAAFTLIELLVVIGIIGVLAAMVGPTLIGFSKGDAMLAANRMMLDGVARARQLAISQHTTVYMVFVPTNYWADVAYASSPNLTLADRTAATNLAEKQLVGFNFVTLRSLADQPGKNTVRYLSSWQTLPDKAFIAQWKFNLDIYSSNNIIDANNPLQPYQVRGFNVTRSIPFPLPETKAYTVAQPYVPLPFIAFDYQGHLISTPPGAEADGEFIPLAHGSVAPARDSVTRRPILDTPSIQEQPSGNSTNSSFNLVHIDQFSGRARLERQQVK